MPRWILEGWKPQTTTATMNDGNKYAKECSYAWMRTESYGKPIRFKGEEKTHKKSPGHRKAHRHFVVATVINDLHNPVGLRKCAIGTHVFLLS